MPESRAAPPILGARPDRVPGAWPVTAFRTVGLIASVLLSVAAATTAIAEPHARLEPEAHSGRSDRALATASKYMISAAHPAAADAGREMLRAGGSAVDAAIAAQLVLGLVEPQSSGLGGGAFLLAWDQTSKTLKTYDGRETAPAAAKPDRFLKAGKPMPFQTAVRSGLSVGTPGLVRLLEQTHKTHGKLPWARLFEPATKLARDGFEVSPRLHYSLRWFGPSALGPEARAYFFDSTGSALPIGQIVKNLDYATTLEAIAQNGASAFYSGPVAEAIVAAVQGAASIPGDLTIDDLASYTSVEREPVCSSYRTYKICGMGPPSSGGIAVSQILALIEPFDIGTTPADAMSAPALHLITEAERLAFADRGRYLADRDFVPVPAGLLDRNYLKQRSALIDPGAAMARPEAGTPPGAEQGAYGIDATRENVGTSHLSVVDAEGNAVALTTTIEGAFGSGLFAAGFLLNNQMTDFSFLPEDAGGRPIANRVEPNKRPRSSMAPTLVFDDKGDLFAALGSPGGSRIILYVAKALIGLIDWKLDAQEALALPNFGSTGKSFEIELGWSSMWHALTMKSYGHRIAPDVMVSGLHAIVRRANHLEGGADPRREGIALGD